MVSTMFCHAEPRSFNSVFFLSDSDLQIQISKNGLSCFSFTLKSEASSIMENCIVTLSRLLIKHWSFGFIEISPLTRSMIHEKLFWFHTRVLFSAPRRPIILLVNYDSCWHYQMSVRELEACLAKWAVFKIPGFVCKRFLPFFPTPSLYLHHFSRTLWLSFLVLFS